MNNYFKPGQTVLFQGDSITDCARESEGRQPYGFGYAEKVKQIYDRLFSDASVSSFNRVPTEQGESYPPNDADSGVIFINRGISGNKTSDLVERYDRDFKEVKPDFISILIGVNEALHHQLDKPETYFPPEKYERLYRQLLEQLRSDLPKAKIMIIEPFLIPTNRETYSVWKKEVVLLAPIARDLAIEYADYYLPMWGIFANLIAQKKATPAELSKDGIHPTPLGHSVIATEYLKVLGII